jgi:hypothetical protein
MISSIASLFSIAGYIHPMNCPLSMHYVLHWCHLSHSIILYSCGIVTVTDTACFTPWTIKPWSYYDPFSWVMNIDVLFMLIANRPSFTDIITNSVSLLMQATLDDDKDAHRFHICAVWINVVSIICNVYLGTNSIIAALLA